MSEEDNKGAKSFLGKDSSAGKVDAESSATLDRFSSLMANKPKSRAPGQSPSSQSQQRT